MSIHDLFSGLLGLGSSQAGNAAQQVTQNNTAGLGNAFYHQMQNQQAQHYGAQNQPGYGQTFPPPETYDQNVPDSELEYLGIVMRPAQALYGTGYRGFSISCCQRCMFK